MSKNKSSVMHIRGSRLIYIPKGIVSTLDIKSGDIYKFHIDGNRIIMTPIMEIEIDDKHVSPAVSNQ